MTNEETRQLHELAAELCETHTGYYDPNCCDCCRAFNNVMSAYALGQQSQKGPAARFLEDEAAKLRGTSKRINQVDAHVVSVLLTMAAAIRSQEVTK